MCHCFIIYYCQIPAVTFKRYEETKYLANSFEFFVYLEATTNNKKYGIWTNHDHSLICL